MNRLLDYYARVAKPRFVVEKRLGLLMLLDQVHVVDRRILVRGAFERDQLDRFTAMVREARREGEPVVFLDIGAHAALYSMVLSSRLAFDRVIAFEPDPTNLAQLRANLMMNGLLDRIEVVQRAASDAAGFVDFYVGSPENRGVSRLSEAGYGGISRKITVQAVRLDDEVQLSGALLVAKIDVEGAELRVLDGMQGLLAANRCLLQIESHKDQRQALLDWMAERGFAFAGGIKADAYFTRL